MPKENKLTPKQQAFVAEYLIDLNATQAAIRAGYSKKVASEIGYENLRKPQIEKEIQKAQEERSKRCEITADQVTQELGKIAFSNILDFVEVTPASDFGTGGIKIKDFSKLPEGAAACIAQVRDTINNKSRNIKFKLHPKVQALDQLMKRFGAYAPTTHEISPELLDRILGALPVDYARAVKNALKRQVGRKNGLSRSVSH